ncbi:hypothetical protein [Planococcus sp. CAU13]|uniref:hypothetical protein n=1 Tax=Planococcus sp. CAU13 TaxID=1541197 RepID=UPI00052FDBAB|nr:hypothetical protein [Planococcus sp. CAU13]
MRYNEIGEAVEGIYKNGELLKRNNSEIIERTYQLKETIVNLLKETYLKEIEIAVNGFAYHIDVTKNEIYISTSQFPGLKKLLTEGSFDEPFTEVVSREEKMRFIEDVPEILKNINNKIRQINVEVEEILDKSKFDFFNVYTLPTK